MRSRSSAEAIAPPQNGSNPRPLARASGSWTQDAGEREGLERADPRYVRRPDPSTHAGTPLPTLVDIQSVSSSLGISTRQLRRFVAQAQIPYVRVGHLIRFDPDEVNRWIDERRSRQWRQHE